MTKETLPAKGWIKLHREFIKWEWYDDHNTSRLFLHLLLTVNFEDKPWHGITIERGSIVTSSNTLAEQTKLSRQQTRTSLEKLQLTNEITIKATKRYSLITVCKYNEYQKRDNDEQPSEQPSNNQVVTKSQPSRNQVVTTTKEEKNSKKEKKEDKKIIKKNFNPDQLGNKIMMTDDQYNNLIESHGKNKVELTMASLAGYAGYTKYKNHYSTIQSWIKRDNGKGKSLMQLANERETDDLPF